MEGKGRRGSFHFEREKVVQELHRGLEMMKELKESIPLPAHETGTDQCQDLADKVSESLKKILALVKNESCDINDDYHQSNDGISPPAKIHRRFHKQRIPSHSWTQHSLKTPFQDDFSWRKYGQKKILTFKHPRDYFKCSLNKETQCPARKHVQRIQDNPPMYKTIYFHQHSCQNHLNPFLTTSDADNDDSNLLRFDTSPDSHSAFFSPSPQLLDNDYPPTAIASLQKPPSPSDEFEFLYYSTTHESEKDNMATSMDGLWLASLESSNVSSRYHP